jgi:hypothetical protein
MYLNLQKLLGKGLRPGWPAAWPTAPRGPSRPPAEVQRKRRKSFSTRGKRPDGQPGVRQRLPRPRQDFRTRPRPRRSRSCGSSPRSRSGGQCYVFGEIYWQCRLKIYKYQITVTLLFCRIVPTQKITKFYEIAVLHFSDFSEKKIFKCNVTKRNPNAMDKVFVPI